MLIIPNVIHTWDSFAVMFVGPNIGKFIIDEVMVLQFGKFDKRYYFVLYLEGEGNNLASSSFFLAIPILVAISFGW